MSCDGDTIGVGFAEERYSYCEDVADEGKSCRCEAKAVADAGSSGKRTKAFTLHCVGSISVAGS